MELGVFTFGDVGTDPRSGDRVGFSKRLKQLIEEIRVADEVGLDVFGVGEHHRPDFAVSAPATVLAAAATQTKRIRLTSAVSVLSSDDPIRIYQQFSTVDGLSDGRAEIMAGRGSFTESFPLFGYDLNDYDDLFSEKLNMLLELNRGEKFAWPGGRHTPLVHETGIYPRPVQDEIPIWLAAGGNPDSIRRGARLGLPLALAIIGGQPARFVPLFQLYREVAVQSGHDLKSLKTSLNVQGFVADNKQVAKQIFFEPYTTVMNRIAVERGFGLLNRQQLEDATGPRGNLFLGSPEEVAAKIIAHHEIFGFDRFCLQMAIGVIPHAHILKSIELFGTRVAPIVRDAVRQ